MLFLTKLPRVSDGNISSFEGHIIADLDVSTTMLQLIPNIFNITPTLRRIDSDLTIHDQH